MLNNPDGLYHDLMRLEALAARGQQGRALAELARIVPGFRQVAAVPAGGSLAVVSDAVSLASS